MNLLDMVVRALSDLVVSIDLSDDELVDPDFASRIFDDLAAVFDEMSGEDRERIAAIVVDYAMSISDPRRKGVMSGLPESIGILASD